ncbi:MFS transporter [Clostridium tunisiense]|uniref:MFS transporter n=1 Tax=Clostridium tunisiense TaxID=219748 RepID=UPI001FA7007C|nr:MFS transporter [Clostridium tunisiense]
MINLEVYDFITDNGELKRSDENMTGLKKALRRLLKPYMGLPKEVYIIFLSKVVNALGCFVMPLLTIILKDSIGLSDEMTGAYISASGLLYLPASVIGGKLADTIGRKKVIVVFDFLATVLYISCSFMEPSMTMVYTIMLAGACMVAAGPAHDSLLADITTSENREGAYSLVYMGWNLGFAVGPVIGGILYENNLHLVFIGDAITALISLGIITFFIKETIHTTKEEIKDESRALERREEGSIFSVLRKRPILIYFALIVFWFNFSYSQWSFLMPLHVLELYPSGKAKFFGLLSGLNGVVVIICTPLVTFLLQNAKSIRKTVYGGLLYAIGFGMLGFFNALPHFFLSVVIFTLGEIVLAISTSPFIANHTPASHRGRMSAVLPIIFGAGHTLGPIGMGKILNLTSIEGGWKLVGVICIIASAIMLSLEAWERKAHYTVVEEAK